MKTEKRRGPGSQEILRLEAGRRKWQRRLGSSRSLRKGECDVLKARRGKTIKECAEIQYSELNGSGPVATGNMELLEALTTAISTN